MKIVLATSPGIDSNGNYIIYSPSRWCEGIKFKSSWFAYYPWELAYLSSLLKKETNHNIKLIDGCFERLDKFKYYNKILKEKPNWLIIEAPTRTISETLWLAKRLKREINTKLIFVGQHATAFPKDLLEEGIDYVFIGEYEFSVLELLKGKDTSKISGLYPNGKRALLNVNRLPFPEDNDIKRFDYSIPGEPCCEYKEIEVFASRGCPFSCNFCVARNVYYNISNWRPREIGNIIDEIRYLKDKYPKMEGIFFNEEVHNGGKDFILNLSKNIINNNLDYLHYQAMCDIRLLNKETIYAMKQAGYYKIRIGIESVSNKVLKAINKNIDLDELEEKLNICKKNDIKTYGTFMFGAYGSSPEEDIKTIRYMQNLIRNNLLDDVQISIATPQPGTPFYNQVNAQGYINTDNFSKFDGGLYSVVDYPYYSAREIQKIKDLALKIRDREIFKRKINKGEVFKWIKDIYRKYEFRKLLLKLIKRLYSELKFSISLSRLA